MSRQKKRLSAAAAAADGHQFHTQKNTSLHYWLRWLANDWISFQPNFTHTHTHVIKQTKNDFLHWLSHRLATLFIRGSSPVMSSVKRARERRCHLRLTLSFDGRCLFCTTCSMKNGTGWQWFITLWGPSGRGVFFFAFCTRFNRGFVSMNTALTNVWKGVRTFEFFSRHMHRIL